ncbi:MAG TPA: hypothetical protein VFU38_05665 [Candidatus Krumholzibacteria bacterium]|nr:hypothetical protein [Candidatus Krumholzibacteria bacterium]
MPKQKDLKRLVRTRMKKTGQSYTTARAYITKQPAKAPKLSTTELETLAGIKNTTILSKSGKSWPEWVRILDAIDGTKLSHTDIARIVHEKHGVGEWWSQSVTVGYERIRGLREKGQRRSGRFDASKSKTLAVPASVAFDAFVDARTRKKWLKGLDVTIRTATKPKSIRIGWPDGKIVAVWITAKGNKCTVGVQQDGLATRAEANERKAFWTDHLAALEELLVD